jgi:hypothetical protein
MRIYWTNKLMFENNFLYVLLVIFLGKLFIYRLITEGKRTENLSPA